ncbi:MAG: VOC family protein [Chloroflexota bacterium]|nr:MAG: hypothetical protein DIU68_06115 [Chloroflexota bacterium]
MLSLRLNVRDAALSQEFYVNMLGFQAGEALPSPDGKPIFAGVTHDGTLIMLDATDQAAAAEPDRGKGIIIDVQHPEDFDIDSFYNRLKDAGVPVVTEIADQFWGYRMFAIADPDGYAISFQKKVFDANFDDLASFTAQGNQ